MQNIDPIYFVTPIVVMAFSFGAAAYWHRRRRLTIFALLFSLAAYSGAIFAKYVFRYLTYGPLFLPSSGGNPFELGAYFGLQTTFLEVGGAYLVARYAVSHGMLRANDAEGYGIGLALWENGVLIGGSLLLDYAIYYATLSTGSSAAGQMLTTLLQSSPALFDTPPSALPLIGYAILERVSSLLIHFSWGYLCVLAAAYKKRALVLVALPMGLVDFFAPFAGSLGTAPFEGLIFTIALVCVLVALTMTRRERKGASVLPSSPILEEGSANLGSLFYTNFRRALSFGKVYVVMGMVLPLLLTAELSFAGGAASAATAGGSEVLAQLYPLILPVFIVLGASGALMIFASDKEKGVYEYMLAYGVDVSTIFWSVIAATLGLVTLVLAVSLAVTTAALAFTNASALSVVFGELVIFYTVPLSYAAAMLMSMTGMIWSQLTARRPGVNSPVGIAPLLGIAPVLAVLILAVGPGSGHILEVVGAASVAMVLGVAAMASVADRKMQRERFLSNA